MTVRRGQAQQGIRRHRPQSNETRLLEAAQPLPPRDLRALSGQVELRTGLRQKRAE